MRISDWSSDVCSSDLGAAVAEQLGHGTRFVAADVTDEEQMKAVFSAAAAQAPLRVTVHCAGRGAPLRILDKNGEHGSLQTSAGVITTNLIGSFNTKIEGPSCRERVYPYVLILLVAVTVKKTKENT